MKTLGFFSLALLVMAPALASATEQRNWRNSNYPSCDTIEGNESGDNTPRLAPAEFSDYSVVQAGSSRTISWKNGLGHWDVRTKESAKTAAGKAWYASIGTTRLTYFEPKDKAKGELDNAIFILRWPTRPGVEKIVQFGETKILEVELADGKARVVGTCSMALRVAGYKLAEDQTAKELKVGDDVTAQYSREFLTNGVFSQ